MLWNAHLAVLTRNAVLLAAIIIAYAPSTEAGSIRGPEPPKRVFPQVQLVKSCVAMGFKRFWMSRLLKALMRPEARAPRERAGLKSPPKPRKFSLRRLKKRREKGTCCI